MDNISIQTDNPLGTLYLMHQHRLPVILIWYALQARETVPFRFSILQRWLEARICSYSLAILYQQHRNWHKA